MAEAIVSLAVERITDLLIQEADFLSGARGEVVHLQEELKRMQCFLKDADHMQDQDERVRNWVSQIRAAAYDAEDVIDTFILKAATGRGEGARALLKGFTSIFTKGLDIHEIRNQIEAVRTRIGDISASMQTYGIQFVAEKQGSSSPNAMQQRLRRSYPHEEEEHVVSFEQIARDVKAQLMVEEERLRVVSVVGMGGLGKTTLAKKIYNDVYVKQHFECCAWAFVSQQFSIRDILVRVLMNVSSIKNKSKYVDSKMERREEINPYERMKEEQLFKSMLEKMEEEDLIKMLYEVLGEKRYLIVLDDIWNKEAWDCLKHAFPNGKRGSKVLFTTRNREVASHADPRSALLEPPFLTTEESWDLLSRKAFLKELPEFEKFEELGREMAKRCGGLPLAVVVLGGILATKKSLKEWVTVQRNINSQLAKLQQQHQYGGVYGILGMSYQDLPFHLKPCFLHLSQFPEDYEFQKRPLIRMWTAEGFVPQPIQEGEKETMEDVGEQYLDELVSRCTVQVSKRDHTGIGVKIFRMHDLMRDMCISKARDENFAAYIEHQDSSMAADDAVHFLRSAMSMPRRVGVHPRKSVDSGGKRCYAPLVKCGDAPNLRSLAYFCESGTFGINRDQEMYFFKNFRLLRVLNLRGITIYNWYMHRAIGNLIHLRYLGLRDTMLLLRKKLCFHQSTACLPVSIGKLKNLYTNDLRDNYNARLPKVLWKLENLRHLLVNGDSSIGGSTGFGSLRQLETLKTVEAKSLIIRKDAAVELPNLRNLGIKFTRKEEAEIVLKSHSIFGECLRSLKM